MGFKTKSCYLYDPQTELMELIGQFKSEQLNDLTEELQDHPDFFRKSVALGYDQSGNILSCGMQFVNTRNGVTAELFEQIGLPALVNFTMDHGGQRMMLASNRALANPAFFWTFYEGLAVVQDAKGSGPGYVRRMN